jgi:hypothetical protein
MYWRRGFALLLVVLCTATRLSSQPFPESWVGTWKGTLTGFGAGERVTMTVPVTMTIAPTADRAVFQWRQVFNNDSTVNVKDYLLRVDDAASGRYSTDERNGIVIDATYVGGALVSVFRVGLQVLETRVSLQADSLVQDLIFWSATPVNTTTGSGPNGERGTAVTSFRVSGRQRIAMSRVRLD